MKVKFKATGGAEGDDDLEWLEENKNNYTKMWLIDGKEIHLGNEDAEAVLCYVDSDITKTIISPINVDWLRRLLNDNK